MTKDSEKKERRKGGDDDKDGRFIQKQERVKPWPRPKPPKDNKE
ncbi:MAG: hypothetical protein PHR66_14625 [Desulfuromonadaceae bacterium]|nr:hypothetical protein [Desulfuromonadaceae bacterium]